MRGPSPDTPSTEAWIPLKITLVYVIVGGTWILFAETLLPSVVRDPAVIARLQVFKGWLFICVTALMLYWLIRRTLSALARSEQALRESEEKFHMLVENTASAMFIYREKIKRHSVFVMSVDSVLT